MNGLDERKHELDWIPGTAIVLEDNVVDDPVDDNSVNHIPAASDLIEDSRRNKREACSEIRRQSDNTDRDSKYAFCFIMYASGGVE